MLKLDFVNLITAEEIKQSWKKKLDTGENRTLVFSNDLNHFRGFVNVKESMLIQLVN